MELIWVLGVLLSLLIFSLSVLQYCPGDHRPPLPPGKRGWPVIGESMELLSYMKKGHSEKFIFKRMAKYSPDVFKTSVLGDNVAVLCGAEGSKFLFTNTNKLVGRWLPTPIRRILISNELEATVDQYIKPAVLRLMKPDVLRDFVGIMDNMAQRHLESYWHHGEVITVYPLVKSYTFALACRLLLAIEDPNVVQTLLHPMETITSGIQSLPINLPGTQMNRAMKAATSLRQQIKQIVSHQRSKMQSGSHDDERKNLLSHFLEVYDDDMVVSEGVLGVLFAGHESVTSVLTMIFKVMADFPDIYQRVYQENMEVGASKMAGELLRWEDAQKLRYTWNVAREVMRLYPPAPFHFREAVFDFTYVGYHILKGYKLITSIHATHKDPKYFPEPEKFEPSRFEGDGPLPYTYHPFGGGSQLCPRMNYAQLEMLVFIHNAVKKFKWETLIPNEEIMGIPFPKPAKGLPVLLHPHAH